MLSGKEILEAVIAKANSADEATLIRMLEVSPLKREDIRLNDEDMAELERTRQRRIDGEQGSTLEEIVSRINAKRANGGL